MNRISITIYFNFAGQEDVAPLLIASATRFYKEITLMLEIKKLNISQFESLFSTEESCLKFISEQKWSEGFICRKCGHTNFCKGKTEFSRRCTRCKSEESATANTIFHRCHIPITEALRMVYMVCHDPGISSYELSRQLEKRQMTCWKLKSKLMECIEKKGEIDLLYKE